jgi:hypothetical protein
MKINRVLLATNDEEIYRQFWPLVAYTWRKLTDYVPTLAQVGDVDLHQAPGETIKLDALAGIPTSFSSQVARLFIPTLFPEEVSLISDIDMLPLSGEYFRQNAAAVADDRVLIYSGDAYQGVKYPMCYIAARGSVFGEILGFRSHPDLSDVQKKIAEWHALGLGWNTDELMFIKLLREWKGYPDRIVKLERGGWNPFADRRVDRIDWKINPQLLKQGYYIDAHMPRPFADNVERIMPLANYIGLNIRDLYGDSMTAVLQSTIHQMFRYLRSIRHRMSSNA